MNDEIEEICLLIALNVLFGEAESNRDKTLLRDVLANELVFRRANGSVVTKDEYRTELEKSENAFEFLYSENIKLRLKTKMRWCRSSCGRKKNAAKKSLKETFAICGFSTAVIKIGNV